MAHISQLGYELLQDTEIVLYLFFESNQIIRNTHLSVRRIMANGSVRWVNLDG